MGYHDCPGKPCFMGRGEYEYGEKTVEAQLLIPRVQRIKNHEKSHWLEGT